MANPKWVARSDPAPIAGHCPLSHTGPLGRGTVRSGSLFAMRSLFGEPEGWEWWRESDVQKVGAKLGERLV